MTSLQPGRAIVRDLTNEEIACFHDKGWVFAPGYVSRDHVGAMLNFARARMGVTAGEPFTDERATSVKDWWWELSNVALDEDLFAAVGRAPAMGRNVRRLFGRDVGIHYLADALMAKVPQGRADASVATSWHQDLPSFPFDRSGTMACWLALDHLEPDTGTMHFLEGSHRGELYGRIPSFEDPMAIFEYFPYLRDRYDEVASPAFAPGDATFHHCQTLHGAPANSGKAIRWSYTTAFMASDCRYTGASCVYTDGLGLPVEAPVRHPRFPRVWPETGN